MVGDLTIMGAVLQFNPLFQGFVKFSAVMRKRSLEISTRLAKEILEQADYDDPTALVAEYLHDWWQSDAKYDHMMQFEAAFQFHVEKVRIAHFRLVVYSDPCSMSFPNPARRNRIKPLRPRPRLHPTFRGRLTASRQLARPTALQCFRRSNL